MTNTIYNTIVQKEKNGQKQFAVLIDPDKFNSIALIENAVKADVDYFFVGGSLLTNGNVTNCIKLIKENCSIPVILFPGSTMQISSAADAILFLSLISGRNPEMLIGRHVEAAPVIKSYNLEAISTGYMLIESGQTTAALYMSNSIALPWNKDDIALCTALAGEMLGLKLIYMDGGSGAIRPINESMVKKVKENITIPLIVGGGIKTIKTAKSLCKAGADIIVIGNAIENNLSIIKSLSKAIHDI